eukprot:scaffold212222_cov14-Tisochrysis_lutea.AAC.1
MVHASGPMLRAPTFSPSCRERTGKCVCSKLDCHALQTVALLPCVASSHTLQMSKYILHARSTLNQDKDCKVHSAKRRGSELYPARDIYLCFKLPSIVDV